MPRPASQFNRILLAISAIGTVAVLVMFFSHYPDYYFSAGEDPYLVASPLFLFLFPFSLSLYLRSITRLRLISVVGLTLIFSSGFIFMAPAVYKSYPLSCGATQTEWDSIAYAILGVGFHYYKLFCL
jgi:hypothetical protein